MSDDRPITWREFKECLSVIKELKENLLVMNESMKKAEEHQAKVEAKNEEHHAKVEAELKKREEYQAKVEVKNEEHHAKVEAELAKVEAELTKMGEHQAKVDAKKEEHQTRTLAAWKNGDWMEWLLLSIYFHKGTAAIHRLKIE